MRIASVLVALLAALAAGACQGARLRSAGDAAAATPAAPSTRPATPVSYAGPPSKAPRSGQVTLRPADLAGVRAWISARNRQWILGDEVDVYASKEFFSQVLTMNAKVGLVQRTDRRVGDDHLVTMTYIGHPASASAMSNPRAQIGPGLTVSARRTMRVRMAKTRDGRRPVQLRIVARGKASAGRQDDVLRRGEQLELGGVLWHDGRRWVWRPVGG